MFLYYFLLRNISNFLFKYEHTINVRRMFRDNEHNLRVKLNEPII